MSPLSEPKVSVLVPCFNLGRYVEEALDSVFAQTCQDFEILVVNDGSTDEATNQLLNRLDRPRTRVLQTENRGLPAARNHAIAHARGRYLCALDADDRLGPRFLEKTTALLDADPAIAFVSTWLETFGTERWTWRPDRCDFPALLGECVVLTASPVRRAAVEAVGGYDSVRFRDGDEDWDLWISLVERGFRGTILPEVLFHYRRRPGSMMTVCTRGEVRLRLFNQLLEKHEASYLAHLPEVLLHRERECARILRDNWLLEHELASTLEPELARARAEGAKLAGELSSASEEAAALAPAVAQSQRELTEVAQSQRELTEVAQSQRELTELRGRAADLERALAEAHRELSALRDSGSWRITAPLRRGYEGVLALRRRLRP